MRKEGEYLTRRQRFNAVRDTMLARGELGIDLMSAAYSSSSAFDYSHGDIKSTLAGGIIGYFLRPAYRQIENAWKIGQSLRGTRCKDWVVHDERSALHVIYKAYKTGKSQIQKSQPLTYDYLKKRNEGIKS